jgi:hypothetical protein
METTSSDRGQVLTLDAGGPLLLAGGSSPAAGRVFGSGFFRSSAGWLLALYLGGVACRM